MEHLAKKLTHYIISKGTISKEDYMTYKYGIQTGMEIILCMVISCLIAIYLKSFVEFLVCIIVFFSLRAYVGGIHMKHFFSCLICSCTVITGILILAKKFVFGIQISFVFIILLLVVVYKLASVTMKKEKKDCNEERFLKKQQRRILICVGLLALMFLLFRVSDLETLLLYTILTVFSSMVLEMVT